MKFSMRIEFHIYIHRESGQPKESAPLPPVDHRLSPEAFCDQAEKEAVRQKDLLTRSTIDNYHTAIRSFRRFLRGRGERLNLDGALLQRYEHWLHEQQVRPNTVSCYMRSLRALYAKIGGSEAGHLFNKVYTGRATTEKRSIPIDDIARLKAVRLSPHSFLALVRDLFLFSFYALGMPFVDMAFLRRQQISDGQITYYRHKTGQRVTVRIEPCMQAIIDRYDTGKSDYVFPLLRSTDPKRAYDEYLQMLNRYNRCLKQLADRAGVGQRLTSYVARHTWASTAFSSNVDLAVISKALGHANPNHTLVYIRQINDRRVEDANHTLLQYMATFEK